MANYAIISASHRDGAQSLRLAQELNTRFFEGGANVVDLFKADLPLWNG